MITTPLVFIARHAREMQVVIKTKQCRDRRLTLAKIQSMYASSTTSDLRWCGPGKNGYLHYLFRIAINRQSFDRGSSLMPSSSREIFASFPIKGKIFT
jgi:hypothetical protein